MSDEQLMDFDGDNDLSLKKVPFKWKGIPYFIVEASGAAVSKWRNAQMAGAKLVSGDNGDARAVTLGNMADSELILVSECTFAADKDGNLPVDAWGNVDSNKCIKLNIIRSWPNRVTGPLFEKIKEISGLEETDTVEGLEKKITELQKRLDKLRKAKEDSEQELLAKNLP